jgi:uncharacterized protein
MWPSAQGADTARARNARLALTASPDWGRAAQGGARCVGPGSMPFVSPVNLNYNSVTTNMELPVFSWDDDKNASNLAKHGVSFEAAKLVFDDPLHISRQDRIENGEQRWQTIGLVANCVLLLVAHTWVDEDDGTEHIRIVSARRATKIERKVYEQST